MHMQLSLSLQTLTGADEPQSMIVMSYRSPWENRGTERGEVGRGNQRTHTHIQRGGLPGKKEKNLRWTKWRKATKDKTSIPALTKSLSLFLIVLLKIEIMAKAIWPESGWKEVLWPTEACRPPDLLRVTMQTCLSWPSPDAREWHWRSISIFLFFVPVCLKWRQTALGKGEVRFVCACVCVCVVCVGWRFR